MMKISIASSVTSLLCFLFSWLISGLCKVSEISKRAQCQQMPNLRRKMICGFTAAALFYPTRKLTQLAILASSSMHSPLSLICTVEILLFYYSQASVSTRLDLDFKTASAIVTFSIRSRLDYCNSIYHNEPNC